MSSGWCPRLHRFTASTHRVDDDDEAEASELAGSRVVARDWGLGYMKGDRRKPSNGRSRIIDNKPICSMADGSGCGDDQEEPVCSPRKSKMARFFLLPRSKLNRSVAAGGSSFHFPKWTLNKKKEKRHGNGEPGVEESGKRGRLLGVRARQYLFSSVCPYRPGCTVRSEREELRAHLAVSVQAAVPFLSRLSVPHVAACRQVPIHGTARHPWTAGPLPRPSP